LFGNDLAPRASSSRGSELIAEFVKPLYERAIALGQPSYDATAQVIGKFRETAIAASNAATEAYQGKR